MTHERDPQKGRIDRLIDQNLKKAFSDLQKDQMPDEIVDLLGILRVQDDAKNTGK